MNALLAIVITIASTRPSVGQERPKIASGTGAETIRVSVDLSTYVQALLEDELGRSGRFVLVEGGQVAKVLEEVFFQQSGVTTASDMTEIGRHFNVEKLFFLGIHRLYPNYKISVKSPTLKLAQRLIQSTLLEPVQMVFFPAGEFLMGSIDGTPDEQPQHPVFLYRRVIPVPAPFQNIPSHVMETKLVSLKTPRGRGIMKVVDFVVMTIIP